MFAFNHWIDVLEANALHFPQRAALHFLPDGVDVGETLTFAQLHEQSRSLAAALQARYNPGERVLLMLPSSLDYVRTFCACLYAGLIAVPLFPPPSRKPRHLDRVRNVVIDAQPALILAPVEHCEALRELVDHRIDVLTVHDLGTPPAGQWQRPSIDAATVAFLQYTSGSTGTPKGVEVRQRNLIANVELMRQAYGFDEHGAMVNWLPLYHDMGLIGGVLAPLYSGMPCYLMASQTFVNAPSTWLQALSRYRATASFAPNFAYALCNRVVSDSLIAQLDLSAWRHAINGAEPIHPGTLDAFAQRFAACGLNPLAISPGYGQAEATLCVSATPADALPVVLRLDKQVLETGRVALASGDAPAVEFVACGYPQAHHAIAIANPHTFERCAADRIGEVWLQGPSNAEAYWQNPEASRIAFQAQIAGEPGHYLRSGDLGFMHQGQVVICGRLKDLLILNGRNLYPHDIEFAITDSEPGIRTGRIAAFSEMDPVLGREKLVIVAEPQRKFVDPAHHPALFASMQSAVREAADCGIDQIVLVQAGTIPMTTSGKIARQGARTQLAAGTLSIIAQSGATPASPAKRLDVAQLREQPDLATCHQWLAQTLLALNPYLSVNTELSLIGLGLDSIGLADFAARLQRDLGWELDTQSLFGEQTLAHWAQALLIYLGTAAPLANPAPETDLNHSHQSFAQRRLWFLHQLNPQDTQHNLVLHLTLHGALDTQALSQRLDALVERHSVLRTVYHDGVDGPQQQAMPASPVQLLVQDNLQDCLAREHATAIDLQHGPLLRAHLISQGDRHDLLLTLHHIAFDGRSAQLLLAELAAHTSPDRPLQYLDFARWEAAHWTPSRIAAQQDFWRAHLADVPQTLALGGSGASPGQHRLDFSLPQSRCDALSALAREQGMTLFMLLLACYQLVLKQLGGQPRFLLGTDVSGRPLAAHNEVIGFFVNQLTLRCEVEGESSLGEFFQQVREQAQQAYAHQDLPFDLVVAALAPARRPGHAPLFQVKLNYQPSRSAPTLIAGAHLHTLDVAQAPGDFHLVLDLVHAGHGIDATLKYRGEHFDQARALRLQHLWTRLLDEAGDWLSESLPALAARLDTWDQAFQRESQHTQVSAGRSQLLQTKRRSLTL
ncbi:MULTISPECIES: condensation domain-containing protein [Pseudomonas]|uniref:condensation domain-containing protein n=1 Tax=Pseudomonas TaxID=286 RepID=UPI001AEA370B|nr:MULTISPECIES: condensation domain-containing protein [unclassified Pseudomonas]MBP1124417.1 acyl-CoA synthetase (AMP-forming)/AMP-acid ligase II/aryl carrier-like protein [Pseudomonas sp. PvP025]MDQ0398277.1 acyl-CoA synthetase (AMP-forming)/AMP-acid ligase II/aryl carrier-like protein [Pseudomonas sp. PvP006]